MKIGEKNVGMIDRIVRIILGLLLIGVFVMNYVPSPLSYLVAIIGLILLMTGAMGSCGLYSLLGMSTLEKMG